MLVQDQHPAAVLASDSYLETFRVTEKEILDNLVYRLGNGQRAIPRLRNLLNGVSQPDRLLVLMPIEEAAGDAP